MSEVTRIQVGGPEEPRPQSTTDSAIGGSTSPDESSSKTNATGADSSFSDEREEENFESYGENEDSNLDFEA